MSGLLQSNQVKCTLQDYTFKWNDYLKTEPAIHFKNTIGHFTKAIMNWFLNIELVSPVLEMSDGLMERLRNREKNREKKMKIWPKPKQDWTARKQNDPLWLTCKSSTLQHYINVLLVSLLFE